MFDHLIPAWRQLKNGRPGRRFQDRFNQRSEAKRGRLNLKKVANTGVGIILIVIGLIFLPAPGPGSVVLIIGLGMLASEIRFIARTLDGGEVLFRKLFAKLIRYWRQAAIHERLAVGLVPVAVVGVVGYLLVQ